MTLFALLFIFSAAHCSVSGVQQTHGSDDDNNVVMNSSLSPSTQFMLDLYHQAAVKGAKTFSGIVRSVQGVPGKLGDKDAFLFNTSSLNDETVWLADLHLSPRRSLQHQSTVLELWSLGARIPVSLGHVSLNGNSDNEWTHVNASRLLNAPAPSSMGLTTVKEEEKSLVTLLQSAPFLVLFTKDGHTGSAVRRRRSTDDNELPDTLFQQQTESPVTYAQPTRRFLPSATYRRGRNNRAKERRASRRRNRARTVDDDYSGTLPYPSRRKSTQKREHAKKMEGGGGGGGRRRRKNDNRRRQQQQRKRLGWNVSVAAEQTENCRRQSVLVSFAAIGLRNVVAPDKLTTYYCSGSCPGVLNNTDPSQQTSHAALLQLLRSRGYLSSETDPTSSCCTPATFEPVTILYLDEGDKVVLKSFRDLSAKTCSCC